LSGDLFLQLFAQTLTATWLLVSLRSSFIVTDLDFFIPMEWFHNWLLVRGLADPTAIWVAKLAATAIVVACSVVVNLLAKRVIVVRLRNWVGNTRTQWDDKLAEHRVFTKLSHLAPAILIYHLLPDIWASQPEVAEFIISMTKIYFVIIGLLVIDSVLNAFHDIYQTFSWSRQVPIKSFLQVTKLVVYFLAGVLVLSYLLGKPPIVFFSGLGALTAILMLVFKDAILGFVAGIQLTTNKMLAVGDWLEMPKYGADGDVLEIALTTVKVQNWDKTITTVPTYALITESFKNWRGMSESGGRRIKRSINIDMNTIRFCDAEMIERYTQIQFVREYLDRKRKAHAGQTAGLECISGRFEGGFGLTNVGAFREYMIGYLRVHPMINREMTFLVRELQPTAEGLPIEVYVFSKDKRWALYEEIQADIFDHFLAMVPDFDLRVFQSPSGGDVRALRMLVKEERATERNSAGSPPDDRY
jgi:miniconductance mechanosensitive channel